MAKLRCGKPWECYVTTGLPGRAYDKPSNLIKNGPYYLRGRSRKEIVRGARARFEYLEVDGRVIVKVSAKTIAEDVFNRRMLRTGAAKMLPGFDEETGVQVNRRHPVITFRRKDT